MAVDMDGPSSSRMAVASFLTSGSMRIVVAGMFGGMASPLLVHRGATILPPLRGGRGPVVHVGRLHVEHVADAALGLAGVRHALLEVEDQVFGVHAAPIIAVYGVNDMAPWGHMYVNPGLTEP